MSNSSTANPWILDTAATITTGPTTVLKMIWQEPTTEAHNLVVTHANGAIVWDENAIAAGSGISYEKDFGPHGVVFCGFKLTTIDSGKLYVYRP